MKYLELHLIDNSMQWLPSDPMVFIGVVNINNIVRKMTIPLLPLLLFHIEVTMDAYNNNNNGYEDDRGINYIIDDHCEGNTTPQNHVQLTLT